MESYEKSIVNAALYAIQHFSDDIIERVMERRQAPMELTDYSDSYHQERIDIGWLRPKEAVNLIEELSEHEAFGGAMDWDRDWRDALSMLAQETYRNAVINRFGNLMESLNSAFDIAEKRGEIVWELPSPTFPTGVLEWSPDLEREMEAFQRKQAKFQEKAGPRIRKQLRKMIDAFIAKERS